MPGGGAEGPETPRDLTLEINAAHPTIVNLNILRKADPDFAREISLTFLDQVLAASSIPFDAKAGLDRSQTMMENYLDESLALTGAGSTGPIIVEEASFEPVKDDQQAEHESILKQAHRDIRGANPNADQTIVGEYTVTGKEKIN